MTTCDADDVHAEHLSRLSRLAFDRDRAERVRVLCRTRLERTGRRQVPAVTMRATRLVTTLVVGGVGVLYLVALVVTTLRLEDILR